MNEALSGQIGRIGNPGGRVVASALLGGTTSQLVGGKFANGAVTAAFGYAFSLVASRTQGEGSAAPGADEGVSPSRALRRRMVLTEGEGSQEMRISLTISAKDVDAAAAQAYVDTANAGWNVSFVGDDGTTRTFALDLRLVARRGNLQLVQCEPSVCTTGLGAASVGGPKLWFSPAGRPDTPVHEMGHVLGFSTNRAYGTGSIMSGDHIRGVTQRDFDLLWSAYRGR